LFYVAVTRAKDRLILSSHSDKPASEFLSFVS
jgi:superfamily I DNA/RNA helicase